MDPLEELKFFGRLVRNGVLTKEDVEGLLPAARKGRRSLGELAVEAGLLSAERLQRLRRLGGEELPALPGHEYLGLLGKGGTALVVQARDRQGQDVAVKVLLRELTDLAPARQAFLREARLLIDLEHENVVKGRKVGTFQGRLMFLMEYVPGRSLHDLLREGHSFTEDQALYIILQVARALTYLSSQGVVHRDIKPDNILLTSRNQVKLIDLGFAASGGDADDSDTTVGTVAFMAPEQARGQGDLDVRADIYALGATLYQLVVGTLPFEGETNQEVMAAQILESLSSEVLKSRRISPHMHYFIEKMMAKEREVRYQDPGELIADIEAQIKGKKTLQFDPGGGEDPGQGPPFEDSPGGAGKGPPKGPAPRFPVRRRRR